MKISSEGQRDITYLFPIIGSHIKRIGFVRVFFGAVGMYVSIPIMIFIHVTISVFLYQWVLRPFFQISRVRWADHVIIDRYRIQELSWIDKFNCMFCGYANGLVTMGNTEIDHLSRHVGPIAWWKNVIMTLTLVPIMPIQMMINFLGMRVIYDVLVSRPLGLHRSTRSEVSAVLARNDYATGFNPVGRWFIRDMKIFYVRFSMALEQIESSWCPLRHFETRNGIVYPEHHKKFFGPGEVAEMRRLLTTVGTVSERLPTW